MGRHVVVPGARHHRQVRFRLGLIVEGDWHLATHGPTQAETEPNALLISRPRSGGRSLRLADDEVAAEQLEVLAGPEDPRS
jgi:hypothetical protein